MNYSSLGFPHALRPEYSPLWIGIVRNCLHILVSSELLLLLLVVHICGESLISEHRLLLGLEVKGLTGILHHLLLHSSICCGLLRVVDIHLLALGVAVVCHPEVGYLLVIKWEVVAR